LNNILLITSKTPETDYDFDGGSILVRQLIEALPNFLVHLDVFFLRKKSLSYKNTKIRNIKYYEPISGENKFDSRIKNSSNTIELIKQCHNEYSTIIITHLSNAFKLEQLPKKVLKKIIVFPMFTSLSYKMAGEDVQEDYYLYEKKALAVCNSIITPSKLEERQLLEIYNIHPKKVKVIPRGFNLQLFNFVEEKKIANPIQIIYIGAIRSQKNHKDLIKIGTMLSELGIKYKINLVGGGEDNCLKIFIDLVNKTSLNDNFVFHGVLQQETLSELLDKCHINISTSKMETFGRGIYEGMIKGLPTIVYKNLECLWENLTNGNGIIGVDENPQLIANEIFELVNDKDYYNDMSLKAAGYRISLCQNKMIENILEVIL